ncbi:ATP-binding cassette sub-family A member 13-like [Erethizon dorsatum]
MHDLVRALLMEAPVENKPEGGRDFPVRLSQVLFHANNSADLFQLHRDLRPVLHLVRESSTEMANLVNMLLTSPADFRTLCPVLQEVILANLTDLLSFTNNSFPLRNREALEITTMLLGVISDAGAGHVLEPLVEISRTLATLLDDSAGLKDLATTVDSFVKLLQLAEKVSGKMATISETHFISNTKDSRKFFDTLYFSMQQRVQHLVKEMATLKKGHYIFENINDLLVPFLDLVFGMIGVKPDVSQDSDISSLSPSLLTDTNQSKDFTELLEEMAQFLTSLKIDLGDLERLVVAFNNGTRIFPVDSVNLWEEILSCLVPINYIISQINFLHFNPISTHGGPQDTKWERIHEVIPFWDKMLTENSTETGTYSIATSESSLTTTWHVVVTLTSLPALSQLLLTIIPPSTPVSVVEMCQVFQQLEEPSEAVAKLQRAEMVVLRTLIILAVFWALMLSTLSRGSGLSAMGEMEGRRASRVPRAWKEEEWSAGCMSSAERLEIRQRSGVCMLPQGRKRDWSSSKGWSRGSEGAKAEGKTMVERLKVATLSLRGLRAAALLQEVGGARAARPAPLGSGIQRNQV